MSLEESAAALEQALARLERLGSLVRWFALAAFAIGGWATAQQISIAELGRQLSALQSEVRERAREINAIERRATVLETRIEARTAQARTNQPTPINQP